MTWKKSIKDFKESEVRNMIMEKLMTTMGIY